MPRCNAPRASTDGWSEPHTFGWQRRHELEVPDLHVWELPTGELVTNLPARGALKVRRRDGRVVVTGALATYRGEGHLDAERKAARSNG